MKKILNLFTNAPHRSMTPYTSALHSQRDELHKKDQREFFKAASKSDVAKLRKLAERNDIAQLNKQNIDALHIACARGHAEVVRFLVERRANINLCDSRKRSALMKAVLTQREQCVRVLLEHGADPNLHDIGGNTALHCAAKYPPISIAALLLQHKANINATNKKGFTPLTVAVRDNRNKMVEFLLKNNADVNVTDQEQKSPLMVAASKGQIHMLQLLLLYNAEVTLKDVKGWSAHDYAVNNGFFRCRPLLSKHKKEEINPNKAKPQKADKLKKLSSKEEASTPCNEPEWDDTSQSESESSRNQESESSEDNSHSSENDELENSQTKNPLKLFSPGQRETSALPHGPWKGGDEKDELGLGTTRSHNDKATKQMESEKALGVFGKHNRTNDRNTENGLGTTCIQGGKATKRRETKKTVDVLSKNYQKVVNDVEKLSKWDLPTITSQDVAKHRGPEEALGVLSKPDNDQKTKPVEGKPGKAFDGFTRHDRDYSANGFGDGGQLSDWDSTSISIHVGEDVIKQGETDEVIGILTKNGKDDDEKTELGLSENDDLSEWDSPSITSHDDEGSIKQKEKEEARDVLSRSERDIDPKTELHLSDVDELAWSCLENSDLGVNDCNSKMEKSMNKLSQQGLIRLGKQSAAIKSSNRATVQSHYLHQQWHNTYEKEGETAANTLNPEESNINSLKDQVNSLMFELTEIKTCMHNEQQSRQTLEAELVSTCIRLAGEAKESEQCLAAQAEMEEAVMQEKKEHKSLKDSLAHSLQHSHCEERVKLVEVGNRVLVRMAAALQAQIHKLEAEKDQTEYDLRKLADSLEELLVIKHSLEIKSYGQNEFEEETQFLKITHKVDGTIEPERHINTVRRTLHENVKIQPIQQLMDAVETLKMDHSKLGLCPTNEESAVMENQECFLEILPKLPSDRKKKVDYVEKLSTGGVDINTHDCKDLEDQTTQLLKLINRAKGVLEENKDYSVHPEKLHFNLKGTLDEPHRNRTIRQLKDTVEMLTKKKLGMSQVKLESYLNKRAKKRTQKKTVVFHVDPETDKTTHVYKEMQLQCDLAKTGGEKSVLHMNSRSMEQSRHRTAEDDLRKIKDEENQMEKNMERSVFRCSQLEKVNREIRDQLTSLRSFCNHTVERVGRKSPLVEQFMGAYQVAVDKVEDSKKANELEQNIQRLEMELARACTQCDRLNQRDKTL